ncbi:MAG: hypothetical protein ACRDIY_09280 [Chloroflexota bacterium]
MTDSRTVRSPADARRLLALYRRASVPVVRCGILTLNCHDLPVTELGARTRPDLADLARVHRAEGAGDQTHAWHAMLTPTGAVLILELELHRPVRCRCSLVFDVAQHFAWLSRVADSGMLVTTTRPVRTVGDALDSGIAWTIDPAPLAEVLTVARLAGRGAGRRPARWPGAGRLA